MLEFLFKWSSIQYLIGTLFGLTMFVCVGLLTLICMAINYFIGDED